MTLTLVRSRTPEQQKAWVAFGRLLARALREGERAAREEESASRAPYRPNDPRLMQAIARCLKDAKEDK